MTSVGHVVGADQVAQLAGAGELAVGDAARARRGVAVSSGRHHRRRGHRGHRGHVLRPQPGAEVREVVERGEQQPRAEPDVLAHELAGRRDPPPHEGAAVGLGPHRDDAGSRVPAPQPFVFDRHGRCLGDHHRRVRRGATPRIASLSLARSRHARGADPSPRERGLLGCARDEAGSPRSGSARSRHRHRAGRTPRMPEACPRRSVRPGLPGQCDGSDPPTWQVTGTVSGFSTDIVLQRRAGLGRAVRDHRDGGQLPVAAARLVGDRGRRARRQDRRRRHLRRRHGVGHGELAAGVRAAGAGRSSRSRPASGRASRARGSIRCRTAGGRSTRAAASRSARRSPTTGYRTWRCARSPVRCSGGSPASDVTGGDRYHVTAGAGLTVRLPRSLDVTLEGMPLGEQQRGARRHAAPVAPRRRGHRRRRAVGSGGGSRSRHSAPVRSARIAAITRMVPSLLPSTRYRMPATSIARAPGRAARRRWPCGRCRT